MDVDRMYGSFQGTTTTTTTTPTTFTATHTTTTSSLSTTCTTTTVLLIQYTTTTTSITAATTTHCRISEGSYVVGVETLADRRHQVELPVLLVVPERVRHVVRIEPQHAKAGEQGAPGTRRASITRHACEQRYFYPFKV